MRVVNIFSDKIFQWFKLVSGLKMVKNAFGNMNASLS